MKITQIVTAGLAALALVFSIVAINEKNAETLGGTTNFDTVQADTSFRVTSSGTEITKLLVGTCNAATTEGSLEATSTDNYTCTVSGVASGDKVSVVLPTSSADFNGGLLVTGATASTNTITFGIYNGTGAATSSFAQATTSVMYTVYR